MFMALFGLSICIAGCGGGGGVSPAGPTTKVSVITGVVSDGPIKNARVSLDINYNGKYDEGEPFCITNDKGEYRIEYILESGTDYLLIVEGSSTLKTEDPKDNPEDGNGLTFVMFVKMTSTGNRNTDPVSAVYRQDVSPFSFKDYLRSLDTSLGGITAPDLVKIIQNAETNPTQLFKDTIKITQTQGGVSSTSLEQIAELVKSSNGYKDLESTIIDLGVDSNLAMNFSDKDIADLANSLDYQSKTVAKISDVVIAKPLEKATTADVIITNMNIAETNQKMTLTVKPGTLSNYNVSVTPYKNILEIPEFSQIRNNNYSVVLGGDITARDSNGVKDSTKTLSGSAAGFFDGLEYLYFDYSNRTWCNGGQVIADMTLKTAPFVIVKKNNIIEKTVEIAGLSLLENPVVVVKGYYITDGTKTSVVLDAVAVSQPSDDLIVKIPENFIISEVIVIDSELRKMTAENKASVKVAVTDSSTSIAMGPTKFILNEYLLSVLKDGNQEEDFPGLGSYIDTKVPYRGADMFLGLDINSTVREIINENINRYLGPTTAPEFYTVSGDFPGVTIDSAQKVIKVAIGETDGVTKIADIALTWSFDKNRIVRNYKKDYIGGNKKGTTYSSIYTFSTGASLTNVVFNETINEISTSTSGYTQTVSASYEGTAIYERNSADNSMKRLVSAKFDQKHSESNSLTKQTNTVDGLVTMKEVNATEGNLTFDGHYSLYILSYDAVSGRVTVTDVTYAKGYNTQDHTYFNNNTLNAAAALFTSQIDYLDYTVTTNPSWIKGVWTGTFTDSCNVNNPGQLSMSITDTNATWWGQSYDKSRNYGTSVEVYGSTVSLKDDAAIWSDGVKINDTRIDGNWSYNGCYGSYILNKTP